MADDGFHAFHSAMAAGTFEGIGAPDAEDEIPPEWAHGASGGFGWCRNDGDFRLGFRYGFFRWWLDEGGNGFGEVS